MYTPHTHTHMLLGTDKKYNNSLHLYINKIKFTSHIYLCLLCE